MNGTSGGETFKLTVILSVCVRPGLTNSECKEKQQQYLVLTFALL